MRERKEDIPLLVEHIIKNNAAFKNKRLSKKAFKVLSEYAWPVNVRELQNVIHRALFLSKGNTIEPHDLPTDLVADHKVCAKRLEDVEKEHIIKVLREVDGQKRKAAEILGVDPKTLYRKLSAYGMTE